MTPERLIIETFFRIPNKDGADVDFKLNEVQAKLDDERTLRNIIPKARQRGVSTYVVALFLARCLSMRNRRCVIVSHTTDSTTKLLDKAQYILRNLRGGLPADLRYASRNELYFTKTDSILYLGTAGNENVGVGDTITDLHCSEPPLWNNPQSLMKGLFNAVPTKTGTIFIEGTGHGMGNWYHRQCMRAAEGNSQYKLHFFSWTDAPEYRIGLDNESAYRVRNSLDEEERKLVDGGILDLEQIAWRRMKLEEMDFDLKTFKEQFPITLEECFQGTGASFFNKINYDPTANWHRHSEFPHLEVLRGHPYPSQDYFAGVDVGGGTGQDNTVLQIFSIQEARQVAEWVSNRHEPHIAAKLHIPILQMFNAPYVNAERNNHGILYLKELLAMYPQGAIHLSKPPTTLIREYGKIADYGTFTSAQNKPLIIGALRKSIAQDFTIHSTLLKAELDSFVEDDDGKLGAQSGCMDDRVLAAAMALWVYERAAARAGVRIRVQNDKIHDPFSLDGILVELEQAFEKRRIEEG